MFQDLLESRGRRPRRRGAGTAVSVVLHAALIGAAVAATGRANPRPDEVVIDDLVYLPAPPTPAPERQAARGPNRPVTGGPAAPAPAPPPDPVPGVDLPPIDLPLADAGRPLAPAEEFAAGGLRPGAPGAGAGARALGGAPLDADAVDEPVAADPRNPPPRYPEALRLAGLGGRVVARFVVDTLGRVEAGSVEFVAPGDPRPAALEAAVREALGRARFRPARAAGRRVRQLAEAPFVFAPAGAAP